MTSDPKETMGWDGGRSWPPPAHTCHSSMEGRHGRGGKVEQDSCQTHLGMRKSGIEGLSAGGPDKHPEGHPRSQSKPEMERPSQRPGSQLLTTYSPG